MTKLSAIADEARRVAGRTSEARLRTQGDALRALCEARWPELRGPEPPGALARALWNARPPLAELFLDLEAEADPRLPEALGRLTPARGLALLVLSAIERGEPDEARCAFEAMMLHESPAVGEAYARRVGARLRGEGVPVVPWHRHSTRPPVDKAVAAIVAATGRRDANGVLAAIGFLAGPDLAKAQAVGDEAALGLSTTLAELDVAFVGCDDEGIHYELRGTERHAVPRPALARVLAELGHE